MSEISERLYAAITEKEYSYGELSTMTGIPKSAIQRYATGETEKIPLDRLEKLASVLGVSSCYLMGWSDAAEPEQKALSLTSEEDALVRCWRQASDKDKETIVFILKDYGMPNLKTKKGSKLLTSAGV